MTWKDDLLPASFRGAAFFYRDVGREGGRRQVSHEFPLRDDNFLEDLGKRPKTHRVQAYVLGDSYASDRDALEEALDGQGSGTFVHPFKGNLTVGCPSYSVTESDEEGGIARFDIIFVEAGKQPSPTSSTSTDDQAWQAGDDQMEILGDDFGGAYSLDGLPGFMRDILSGNIGALLNDLAQLAGLSGIPIGLLDVALAAILAATEDPEGLSVAIPGFFRGYAAAVVDILPVDDPRVSSRGQPPVQDPSYGLGGLASWGNDIPAVLGSTPQRLQLAANRSALITLVQGSAVAAMAQVYANTKFASAADAEAARNQLSDLVDQQATIAADAAMDTVYAGWMTVLRTTATDLTSRAQQLPLLLDYRFSTSLPALAVAQRIYQDGGRAAELVARNAAPHPLFMPLRIEALAS